MIFGNQNNQVIFNNLFFKTWRFVVLNGYKGIGKHSFIKEYLEDKIYDINQLFIDTIDNDELIRFNSESDQPRLVIIDQADYLSEPAQDSLLKITEEFSYIRFIFITTDWKRLLPPLQSRIDHLFHWQKLNEKEMINFIESQNYTNHQEIFQLAQGIPLVYTTLIESTEYVSFYYQLQKINLFEVPDLISTLKSDQEIPRYIISHLIQLAARNQRSIPLLNLAATLVRNPSVNPELYWKKAALEM